MKEKKIIKNFSMPRVENSTIFGLQQQRCKFKFQESLHAKKMKGRTVFKLFHPRAKTAIQWDDDWDMAFLFR